MIEHLMSALGILFAVAYLFSEAVTRKVAPWIFGAMAFEHVWTAHLGPLAWWIVEVWRQGAV